MPHALVIIHFHFRCGTVESEWQGHQVSGCGVVTLSGLHSWEEGIGWLKCLGMGSVRPWERLCGCRMGTFVCLFVALWTLSHV